MTMRAIVTGVQPGRLMVLDLETRQRIAVITPSACRFRQGNLIRIRYNGVMTTSIPPQIFAQSISALPWGEPRCC